MSVVTPFEDLPFDDLLSKVFHHQIPFRCIQIKTQKLIIPKIQTSHQVEHLNPNVKNEVEKADEIKELFGKVVEDVPPRFPECLDAISKHVEAFFPALFCFVNATNGKAVQNVVIIRYLPNTSLSNLNPKKVKKLNEFLQSIEDLKVALKKISKFVNIQEFNATLKAEISTQEYVSRVKTAIDFQKKDKGLTEVENDDEKNLYLASPALKRLINSKAFSKKFREFNHAAKQGEKENIGHANNFMTPGLAKIKNEKVVKSKISSYNEGVVNGANLSKRFDEEKAVEDLPKLKLEEIKEKYQKDCNHNIKSALATPVLANLRKTKTSKVEEILDMTTEKRLVLAEVSTDKAAFEKSDVILPKECKEPLKKEPFYTPSIKVNVKERKSFYENPVPVNKIVGKAPSPGRVIESVELSSILNNSTGISTDGFSYDKLKEIVNLKLFKEFDINPMAVENHLTKSEFERVFKMSKIQFSSLQSWKKKTVKQELGLF